MSHFLKEEAHSQGPIFLCLYTANSMEASAFDYLILNMVLISLESVLSFISKTMMLQNEDILCCSPRDRFHICKDVI